MCIECFGLRRKKIWWWFKNILYRTYFLVIQKLAFTQNTNTAPTATTVTNTTMFGFSNGFLVVRPISNSMMTVTGSCPHFNYGPYLQIIISVCLGIAWYLNLATAAAMRRSRAMRNANSSLAEFCLCSLASTTLSVFFIDSTTVLALGLLMCFDLTPRVKPFWLWGACPRFRRADKVASLKWAVWPICKKGADAFYCLWSMGKQPAD